MTDALKTSTEEVGDARVRVEVEVETGAVERELASAAQAIGRDMKLPGFRKGKVPPQVVLQRLGREAVFDEALRRALPAWYDQAITAAGVAAVGDPKLDLTELPDKGAPLSFSIEVGVRPQAKLGDYRGLEVGRREPEVTAEKVDEELERLRDSLSSLENVERAAGDGDFVVLDFVGTVDGEPFEGGEARGYMLELGSERLIPGFEQQLTGASAGDELDVNVTFPGDYGAEQLAGEDAVFKVSVKEVKEKRLPELGDELAADAGGFETLDELRADIESKISEAKERAIEGEFREAAVDGAVAQADVDIPHELVHAKAHDMWRQTARALERRGVPPATYLQMTGKSEEELVTEAEPDAERALGRESVLAAIVEAETIEVSDDELLDTLREAASASDAEQASEEDLRRSLERAREQGRDDVLREDIAMRKAVDVVAESARPISIDQAQARDKLWTPEKGAREEGADKPQPAGGKLWTPGS